MIDNERNGNGAAELAAAFRDHRAELCRFARRRVENQAVAEEVVQETFLRAWRSIHTFNPAVGTMRMWLYSICRNVTIDLSRQRSKEARTREAIGRPAEADGLDDRELERVMMRWQAEDALRRMTDSQRDAVIKIHAQDVPYATAAKELGIPVGTVKSRVHTGLQAARDAMSRSPLLTPA